MDRLRLDYQRDMKPFPVAGMALLLLGIALSVWSGAQYYRLSGGIADIESRLGHREQAAAHEVHASARDMQQASEVLRQLTLPWETLFEAVESAAGRDVTLLSMEPDIDKRVVNIGCEAKNVAAMLGYIKRLQERQEFGSVYLLNHQIQEHDPDRPVRFSLVASWRIAT